MKEFCEGSGADPKVALAVAGYLCDAGKLVKIQEGLYYNVSTLEQIKLRIRQWFGENEALEISDLKTILGMTRKYAIPLLEYLDATRMTIRSGNQRKLRS